MEHGSLTAKHVSICKHRGISLVTKTVFPGAVTELKASSSGITNIHLPVSLLRHISSRVFRLHVFHGDNSDDLLAFPLSGTRFANHKKCYPLDIQPRWICSNTVFYFSCQKTSNWPCNNN